MNVENKEETPAMFWERTAKEAIREANYYRAELVKAHTILGRVIHQLSERWDKVNLTEYTPTSNLNSNINFIKEESGKSI